MVESMNPEVELDVSPCGKEQNPPIAFAFAPLEDNTDDRHVLISFTTFTSFFKTLPGTCSNKHKTIMKFYLATALWCLSLTTADAFSAVAPGAAKASLASGGAPNLEPVDKTMSGLPKETNAFDPTEGENAALQRNNNNEVWVPQVRTRTLAHNSDTRSYCTDDAFHSSGLSHTLSCTHTYTARQTPPQPQITRYARNGPRKHCHTLQFHIPAFHSRRRLQPTHPQYARL